MNKLIMAVLAILYTVTWCSIEANALAQKRFDERSQLCRIFNGQIGWDSEPWGMGGEKFREVCKSCHTRGNDVGAPFLHAESFMPRHWNRIFSKQRVKCAKDGSWDSLNQDELLSLNDFLFRFGDWTYDPNDADSCG